MTGHGVYRQVDRPDVLDRIPRCRGNRVGREDRTERLSPPRSDVAMAYSLIGLEYPRQLLRTPAVGALGSVGRVGECSSHTLVALGPTRLREPAGRRRLVGEGGVVDTGFLPCPNCGRLLPSESPSCPSCGRETGFGPATNAPPPAPSVPTPPSTHVPPQTELPPTWRQRRLGYPLVTHVRGVIASNTTPRASVARGGARHAPVAVLLAPVRFALALLRILLFQRLTKTRGRARRATRGRAAGARDVAFRSLDGRRVDGLHDARAAQRGNSIGRHERSRPRSCPRSITPTRARRCRARQRARRRARAPTPTGPLLGGCRRCVGAWTRRGVDPRRNRVDDAATPMSRPHPPKESTRCNACTGGKNAAADVVPCRL